MISGERVRFRGVEKDDLSKFVLWLNDPEVIDGLGMYVPLSTEDENRWFEKLADREPAEKPFAIEASEGEDWRLAGNIEFAVLWRRQAEIDRVQRRAGQ